MTSPIANLLSSTWIPGVVRSASSTTPPSIREASGEVVGAVALFVILGLLLVFLLLAVYLALRIRRSSRIRSEAGSSAPTLSEDVWAMHKTPDLNSVDDDPSNL